MTWNWDPQSWKRSSKILLGIVTIWPIIYIGNFVLGAFSMVLFVPFADKRTSRNCGNVDLLQLDRKIKNGEIKKLTLRPREIIAVDRAGDCEFTVAVSNQATRDEIVNAAREVVNGRPQVENIEDESARDAQVSPFLPAGFIAFFALHMLTILLTLALMPIYIVLAVNNQHLDQSMRIVWIVLLCTMTMLVNPVYWYLYVWKKRQTAPPSNPVMPAPSADIPSVS